MDSVFFNKVMAEKNGVETKMEVEGDDHKDVDRNSGPSRKKQCNGQRGQNVGPKDGDEEEMNGSHKRCIRKDDSGISERDDDDVQDEDDVTVEVSDPFSNRINESGVAKDIRRLKVGTTDVVSDKSSPDSGHNDVSFAAADEEEAVSVPSTTIEAPTNVESDVRTEEVEGAGGRSEEEVEEQKFSDDDDDEDNYSFKSDVAQVSSSDEEERYPMKPKPKHKWFLCPEVVSRQYGISNNYSNDLFRLRAYGSLHMVERLELMYKMKRHEGCVNTLHFNATGTRLASGSDDLNVIVWDWAIGEPVLTYDSGHRSNVFQAKFMPLGGDCHVVSCARDGQVRLAELSSTGVCKGTRRVANHRGPAHKLALEPDSPHTFLSCGEDGVVFKVDVRENKPERLLICKENERKVPLYSIFAHPSNPNEFAIGGKDHFVRLYDQRLIGQGNGVLKKFCPHHVLSSDIRANVTCLVYNHDGSEILASYNDEDIYTFDTSHSDGADFTHRYQGHRNSATVKGVNYFGPNSEFIVSGSDCGHIYMWERGSESIVQFMPGDEGGVVNCLEPHPHIPILATSGLDDNIKIWVPSCETPPKLNDLKAVIRMNHKERDDDRRREPETIDGQMLWFLMHHLRRSARRRARQEGQRTEEDSSSDEEETNSDEDEDGVPPPVQCATS